MMANKDAGMSIDLGRNALLQDDFIVHVAFLCVLIHNTTWANLHESHQRQVLYNSADI